MSELLHRLNDEAVITHGQLLREMLQRSAGHHDGEELLAQKGTIHTAIDLLTQIGKKVLDPTVPDGELRKLIVPGLIQPKALEAFLKTCEALIAPSETNDLAFLDKSYSALRRFAPKFPWRP